jgi:hypothetical protein
MVGQVNRKAVKAVGDHRARGAAPRPVRPKHEVIDEELRVPSEEVCQRGAAIIGLEPVLLADSDPRQRLPPPRQLVAAPRQLLLRLKQLEPRCQPLFTCPGHVFCHRPSLRVVVGHEMD